MPNISCCLAFLLLLTCATATPYDWITRQKLRGGYLNMNNPLSVVAQMKDAGMNTLLIKTDLPVPLPDSYRRVILAWGAESRKHGMRCFILFNWRGSLETLVGDRRYVTEQGIPLAKTPCPLDQGYWARYVRDRMAALAVMAPDGSLTGAVLDPEMYAGDQVEYTGYCYCDDCLREFLAANHQLMPKTLPAPDYRVRWLVDRHLLEAYQQHFINSIRTFCADTERTVHTANPDFLLGELHTDRSVPFHRGVAMGLGTPTHPALCFSETTYERGYFSYVKSMQHRFTQYPASVLFLPGLSLYKLPLTTLPTHSRRCALNADGYWVWTLEGLVEDKPSAYYTLPEPKERYWQTLRETNRLLDRDLQTPPEDRVITLAVVVMTFVCLLMVMRYVRALRQVSRIYKAILPVIVRAISPLYSRITVPPNDSLKRFTCNST